MPSQTQCIKKILGRLCSFRFYDIISDNDIGIIRRIWSLIKDCSCIIQNPVVLISLWTSVRRPSAFKIFGLQWLWYARGSSTSNMLTEIMNGSQLEFPMLMHSEFLGQKQKIRWFVKEIVKLYHFVKIWRTKRKRKLDNCVFIITGISIYMTYHSTSGSP